MFIELSEILFRSGNPNPLKNYEKNHYKQTFQDKNRSF